MMRSGTGWNVAIGGLSVGQAMSTSDLEQRAEHHAREAERLLAGRLGFLNNIIKASVHATLAVYYATQAQRSSDAEHES
jgi:hypothetical protein